MVPAKLHQMYTRTLFELCNFAGESAREALPPEAGVAAADGGPVRAPARRPGHHGARRQVRARGRGGRGGGAGESRRTVPLQILVS